MLRFDWVRPICVVAVAATLSACHSGGGDDDTPQQPTTFTVGGTVTGISGSVVLRLNGGNDLTVNASGTFAFTAALANGASYTVTVLSQPTTQVCGPVPLNNTGTINGANVTNIALTCANYSIGGTVTGLTKAGLKLVVNGSPDLDVPANDSTFTFPASTSLGTLNIYVVSIKAQPAGQTCLIIQTTGIVSATAPNVSGATGPAVDCIDNVTDPFSGTYLVIDEEEDNDALAVITLHPDGRYLLGVRNDEPSCTNDGTGVQYGVYNWNQATQVLTIVKHAPIGLGDDCGLDVGEPITLTYDDEDDEGVLTFIEYDGTVPRFEGKAIPVPSAAGTLVGSWGGPEAFVVLSDNNKLFHVTTRWIAQNPNTFPGIEDGCYSLASGTTAAGSITFDFGAGCLVNGTQAPLDTTGFGGFSDVAGGPRDFTVTGDAIQLLAGAPVSPFILGALRILPTQLPTTFSISATISGLNTSGLVLQTHGKNSPAVAAGSTNATLATDVPGTTFYVVTVQQQPTGQYCTLANGIGVLFANVTNVAVTCTAIPGTTYTVSGTVNGLTGTGLALRMNGHPTADFNVTPVPPSPASYVFAAGLQMGTPFSIGVLSQPATPTQFCFAPTGVAGTINASNVTVNFNCINSVPSVVGGNVTGLAASTSLHLRLNYGDAAGVPAAPVNGIVNANGALNVFSGTPVPANGFFELGIVTQPAGQTCTITRSAGVSIATSANVTIACVSNPASVLTGTYSAIDPEGLDSRWYFNFNADGTYTTAMIHNDWKCDNNDGTPLRYGNGVEYGVFQWNTTTGEFHLPAAAAIDTNGGCGFSNPGGVDDGFRGYITRVGNAIEVRETQGGPLIASVPAVMSNAGTLVGAWVREAGNGSLLVFHADNSFLYVETQVAGLFPSGYGQERGCYSASAPTSGTITVTIDTNCLPDDLGSYDLNFFGGLLAVPAVRTASFPFTLAGDTLTLRGVVYKRTQPN